jgi:HPt (histidine-containing phosphotransfer) domain-containing protein
VNDPTGEAFEALQLEYLASMPARLEELRSDIAGFRVGSAEAEASLKVRLHRLAGSGGAYGFTQLSSLAREAESCLASARSSAVLDQLGKIVDRLVRTAQEADAEMKKRLAK